MAEIARRRRQVARSGRRPVARSEPPLVVADLHLEKASCFRAPGHRSCRPTTPRATLALLAAIVLRRNPRRVVCARRQLPRFGRVRAADGGRDRARLVALQRRTRLDLDHRQSRPGAAAPNIGGDVAHAIVDLADSCCRHEPSALDPRPRSPATCTLAPSRRGRRARRATPLLLRPTGRGWCCRPSARSAGGLNVLDRRSPSSVRAAFAHRAFVIGDSGLFRFPFAALAAPIRDAKITF